MSTPFGLSDATGLREALDAGATLPADWYSDPAVLRLEEERIFGRTWQYAGRADLVAEPGSYLTSFAGHIPVVVVRDRAETLRAFVNVCRHRGHIVAEAIFDGHRLAREIDSENPAVPLPYRRERISLESAALP